MKSSTYYALLFFAYCLTAVLFFHTPPTLTEAQALFSYPLLTTLTLLRTAVFFSITLSILLFLFSPDASSNRRLNNPKILILYTTLFLTLSLVLSIFASFSKNGHLLKETSVPLTQKNRQSDPTLAMAGWELLRDYITINAFDSSSTIFVAPNHQLASFTAFAAHRRFKTAIISDSNTVDVQSLLSSTDIILITDNRILNNLPSSYSAILPYLAWVDTLDIVRNSRSEKQIYISHFEKLK